MKAIRYILAGLSGLALVTGAAQSQPIDVLSAGAVEPGILAAADAYKKQTGTDVKVRFATAPAIRKQMGEGAKADIVIAPPALVDELAKAGRIDGATATPIGKVGAGVASRPGGPTPDIRNADSLKKAVVAASSIVFNTASTGLYIEKMLEKLGIAEQVKAKSKRPPTGAEVMELLLKGTGEEFGFGPMTEILLYKDKGLRLIGPLPAELQNYTSYTATAHAAPSNAKSAADFLHFLARPATRKIFAERGVE